MDYFKLNKFLLHCNGLYHHKNDGRTKTICLKTFTIFLIILYIVQTVQCFLNIRNSGVDDLVTTCCSVLQGGVLFGVSFQLAYYNLRKEKLAKMFDLLEETMWHQTNTGIVEIDMEFYGRMTKFVTKLWTVMVLLCWQGATSWPLLDSSDERALPLPMWYPYNWRTTPNYQFTYALQYLIHLVAMLTYAAADVVFPSFSVIVVGQFTLLGHCIRNVVNTALLHYGLPKDLVMKFDSTINETSATHLLSMEEENELNAALFSETFHQQLNETLNRYLKKQQLLLKICDDLEDLFHPLLLFKVYLNRLYFCLELFCVLYGTTPFFEVFFIMYAFAALVQLFLQTFFGQIVQNQGLEIFDRLYESPWYLCPKQFKTSLMFAQARTKKPIKFTAGKIANLDMAAFVMFLNGVFSYVTVLRQVILK